MKIILFFTALLFSLNGFSHTPGQLNKYYNYYKLAHGFTVKQLKTKTPKQAKKAVENVCKKITRKFRNDSNYLLACNAGFEDSLKNQKKERTELEKILHNTEEAPDAIETDI